MSINRKMKRKAVKTSPDAYIKETIIETAAIAAEVVFNDWHKLKNKEKRLSTFMDLFIDGLCRIEDRSELRLQIESELRRMVV